MARIHDRLARLRPCRECRSRLGTCASFSLSDFYIRADTKSASSPCSLWAVRDSSRIVSTASASSGVVTSLTDRLAPAAGRRSGFRTKTPNGRSTTSQPMLARLKTLQTKSRTGSSRWYGCGVTTRPKRASSGSIPIKRLLFAATDSTEAQRRLRRRRCRLRHCHPRESR